MSTHHVHVFISHSWTYSEHYEKLREWIFEETWTYGQARVRFSDYSVPKDDPVHNAPRLQQLENAIFRKIDRSHVIVIPTGMYASYSNWIQREIRGSKTKAKPILAVRPLAQQRRSSVVCNAADFIVGWKKQSVVEGIWALYQNG